VKTAVLTVPILTNLSNLTDRYDVIFSDVWGVVHNGLEAHPAAGEALTAFRKKGGVVVMISNAPRPEWSVIEQLNQLGVVSSAYNAVVTSGDVTHKLALAQPDQHCFHIGAPKDEHLFQNLPVKRVPLDQASFAICTGLHDDEVQTAEDYRDVVAALRVRNIPMICANPDLVVERGHKLIPCAGAIAALYEDLGGTVIQAGKPFPPIYAATYAKATELLGSAPDKSRILAIGDAIRTDVAGAVAFGIDCVFLSAGIHAAELHGTDGNLCADKLDQFMTKQAFVPKAVMQKLVW
jgi:HAD superfamily hydrolase (TIGR01459 family)